MLKNRVISILVVCTFSAQVLLADNFTKLLNIALEQSPYISSSYLEKKQKDYEASISTRYENPDLDINYAKFKPETGESDTGYSFSISQPIQFWSIYKDKKLLSKKILEGSTNLYLMNKANFIKELSFLYTQYEFNEKIKKLTNESLEIAQEIYAISNERYSVGSISRTDLLQTQVSLMEIQVENEDIKNNSLNSYYGLLKLAGINYEIDLELNHKFEVISNKGLINNPELLAMRTQQDINLASLNIQSNTFDSFSLTASYDKEPDQTVNRIGISIPLPIFNTKREETKIAFLEAKKNKLSIENRSFQIKQELIRLQKNRTSLKKQIKNNEKVLSLKNQLLEMYMEKYKISQATILELQRIKDSVIQTKKELIQTQLTLKQNAISQNYLQGNLNEKIIIN